MRKRPDQWPKETNETVPIGLVLDSSTEELDPLERLITRYSSLQRLKAAVTWLFRFAGYRKMKIVGATELEIKATMPSYLAKNKLDVAETR